jgi:hypothetical protein
VSVGPDGDFRPDAATARLKEMRKEAEAAWRVAYDRHEAQNTIRSYQDEQEAWDRYMDICGDLHECTQFDCDAYSPDHVLCEKHRPK